MKVERSDQDNHNLFITYLGFGGGSVVKNPTSNSGDKILIPGSGRFLEKEFLPAKFHAQRSPEGYSTCGCKGSDTTD